jgi:hypothetical protein
MSSVGSKAHQQTGGTPVPETEFEAVGLVNTSILTCRPKTDPTAVLGFGSQQAFSDTHKPSLEPKINIHYAL